MQQHNKQHIDQIIEELYLLDPSLRGIKNLHNIVSSLLEKGDALQIDDTFATTLRNKIVALHQQQQIKKTFFSSLTMKHPLYIASAGSALVLLLVAVSIYTLQPAPTSRSPFTKSLAKTITHISDGAFGSLAQLDAQIQRGSAASPVNAGFGGGGGIPGMEMTDSKIAGMLIAPGPNYTYTYDYIGDSFEVPEQLAVYKRQTGIQQAKSLANAFTGTKNGIVSMPGSYQIETATLQGLGPNSMTVSLNFMSAQASLYSSPNNEAARNRYIEKNPGPVTQLSDDELIDIAEEGLKEYGIDPETFGTPVIDKSWKQYQAENGGDSFVPDIQTVIFPIVFDDHIVYEQYGPLPNGLSVNIDLRLKKMNSVWNINTQQYQASDYALVTDTTRLTKVATNGGFNGPIYYSEGPSETINFSLETPSLIYIAYTRYVDNESQELYLPALRFPVQKKTLPKNAPYYLYPPEFITVPLVGELLDEIEGQGGEIVMPVEPPTLFLKEEEN